MNGAVLAVGDELLLGDIVNGNAAWLGEALAGVGVPRRALGDGRRRRRTAGHGAAPRARGRRRGGAHRRARADDRRPHPRRAGARRRGGRSTRSPELEQQLRDRFAAYGCAMPPERAAPGRRPGRGRAAGQPGRHGARSAAGDRRPAGRRAAGPAARDAGGRARRTCCPELAARTGTVVTTRTLRCAGAGESNVAAARRGRGAGAAGRRPGLPRRRRASCGCASPPIGDPAVLEPLVEACAAVLGDAVFGQDDETLPGGGRPAAAGPRPDAGDAPSR